MRKKTTKNEPFTYFSVRIVVVEDAESDGRKDAGEVEEQGSGEDLLGRFDTCQTILVIRDVVGQTS
jgi:hypothetical protein